MTAWSLVRLQGYGKNQSLSIPRLNISKQLFSNDVKLGDQSIRGITKLQSKRNNVISESVITIRGYIYTFKVSLAQCWWWHKTLLDSNKQKYIARQLNEIFVILWNERRIHMLNYLQNFSFSQYWENNRVQR